MKTKDVFFIYGGDQELILRGYSDMSFQIKKDDFDQNLDISLI